MAGEPLLVVVGSVGADAELKFLPSGVACCSWSLAYTPRTKVGDSWSDGETVWIRCTAWRQLGESAAEQVRKGMRLIVHGRLKVRSYEHNGEKRTAIEMDVEDVGADMRYATVTARRVERHPGEDRSPQPAFSGGASSDPWGGDDSSSPPF